MAMECNGVRLIPLTSAGRRETIWINPEMIVALDPADEGNGTNIYLHSSGIWVVSETMDTIVDALSEIEEISE
jgi:hypothetical protein